MLETKKNKGMHEPLGPLLRAFFADHLVQQKAASPQTIHAYRDAFRLLVTFLDQHRHRSQRRSPWTTSTLP